MDDTMQRKKFQDQWSILRQILYMYVLSIELTVWNSFTTATGKHFFSACTFVRLVMSDAIVNDTNSMLLLNSIGCLFWRTSQRANRSILFVSLFSYVIVDWVKQLSCNYTCAIVYVEITSKYDSSLQICLLYILWIVSVPVMWYRRIMNLLFTLAISFVSVSWFYSILQTVDLLLISMNLFIDKNNMKHWTNQTSNIISK